MLQGSRSEREEAHPRQDKEDHADRPSDQRRGTEAGTQGAHLHGQHQGRLLSDQPRYAALLLLLLSRAELTDRQNHTHCRYGGGGATRSQSSAS